MFKADISPVALPKMTNIQAIFLILGVLHIFQLLLYTLMAKKMKFSPWEGKHRNCLGYTQDQAAVITFLQCTTYTSIFFNTSISNF